jgi:hypothetical protein
MTQHSGTNTLSPIQNLEVEKNCTGKVIMLPDTENIFKTALK